MGRILRVIRIMAFPLIFSIFFFNQPIVSFAEDITITTYYPSPAGSYNDLSVNRYLDLSAGAQIRIAGGATSTPIMTVYSDHIEFNVPVTFNGNVTATGNITATGDILGSRVGDTSLNIDLGQSIANRLNYDWTLWTSQNIQNVEILAAMAVAAMPEFSNYVMGAIAIAAALTTIGSGFALPPDNVGL